MRGSGLARVGVIAVDSTKVQANAIRNENLDYEQIARAILEEPRPSTQGWSHLNQDHDAIEQERERAPENFRTRVRWLSIGEAVELPSGGAG